MATFSAGGQPSPSALNDHHISGDLASDHNLLVIPVQPRRETALKYVVSRRTNLAGPLVAVAAATPQGSVLAF